MPQVPLWNCRSGCSLSWVRERQAGVQQLNAIGVAASRRKSNAAASDTCTPAANDAGQSLSGMGLGKAPLPHKRTSEFKPAVELTQKHQPCCWRVTRQLCCSRATARAGASE